MNPSSVIDLLRGRWPALLAVAGLTLGPAVAATSLIDALGPRARAVLNGAVVTDGDSWTNLVLSGLRGDTTARVTVPVLVALAWFVALGVGLRVLGGEPFGRAWRPSGVPVGSWLALGTMLALLAAVSVTIVIVAATELGAVVAIAAAVVFAYELARLALVLPATLVDRRDAAGALALALSVSRRRYLATGTMLVLVWVVPTAVLLLIAARLGEPPPRLGDSWVGDVLGVGVASLAEYLALVVVLPIQAAALLAAYRDAATPRAADAPPAPASTALASTGPPGGDDLALTLAVDGPTPEPPAPRRPVRWPRWVMVAGLAPLLVAPAVVTSAVVLANPHGLPVLTVARPGYGLSARPLDVAMLADGTLASVDAMQVALCADAHCADVGLVGMPCVDGGQPSGESISSCAIEAPLNAADITTDATLLALRRAGNTARLFWCRVERNAPSGQCRWGGATNLYRQPGLWENWSMDVTALPGGGFAAVLIGPGDDPGRGHLLLARCDRLGCPQPTVRAVHDIPLPGGWQGGGTVAIAADPRTGSLAVGYVDPVDATVWLGGCPGDCPDGPRLNRVGSWGRPGAAGSAPDVPVSVLPSLQLVATAAGPVAVVGATVLAHGAEVAAPRATGVIACHDHACATSDEVHWHRVLVTATPTVDDDGTVVVVGSDTTRHQVLIGRLTGPEVDIATSLFAGDVVAAAFGPGDRLRLVLDDDQGLALVTLDR